MASGNTHDKGGLLLAPLAAIAALHFSLDIAIVVGSYLVGIYFLSPDIDCRSNCTRRWGLLKGLWYPYQKLSGHRGFSHIPIVWIGAIVVPVLLLNGQEFQDWQNWTGFLLPIFVGLELSAWVHLFFDYAPGVNKL
jgi:uncharacterized metal-binding protein